MIVLSFAIGVFAGFYIAYLIGNYINKHNEYNKNKIKLIKKITVQEQTTFETVKDLIDNWNEINDFRDYKNIFKRKNTTNTENSINAFVKYFQAMYVLRTVEKDSHKYEYYELINPIRSLIKNEKKLFKQLIKANKCTIDSKFVEIVDEDLKNGKPTEYDEFTTFIAELFVHAMEDKEG